MTNKERADERRDIPAQIAIVDKRTGQVIDHAQATFDEARKVAEKMKNGRENIGYRITKVVS